jgi:crotonobetainyl-CoA:carnitine CoA-transferase CaiB-like acyl-CoA transferase
MISGALEGTTCIDVSAHVAGPYAGSLLGDLGCDVIKVELLTAATRIAGAIPNTKAAAQFPSAQPEQEKPHAQSAREKRQGDSPQTVSDGGYLDTEKI